MDHLQTTLKEAHLCILMHVLKIIIALLLYIMSQCFVRKGSKNCGYELEVVTLPALYHYIFSTIGREMIFARSFQHYIT